jgi:hypothetical protein
MVRSAQTLAVALLVSLPACHPTQAPIESPHASVGFAPDGRPYSTQAIAAAIRRGLMAKKWNVLADQPGMIQARVDAGGHHAVVRITYTAGGWLIEHVDTSPGLRYEEHRRHGLIVHHRYNGWVRRLDAAIREALQSPPEADVTVTTTTTVESPASDPPPSWD